MFILLCTDSNSEWIVDVISLESGHECPIYSRAAMPGAEICYFTNISGTKYLFCTLIREGQGFLFVYVTEILNFGG